MDCGEESGPRPGSRGVVWTQLFRAASSRVTHGKGIFVVSLTVSGLFSLFGFLMCRKVFVKRRKKAKRGISTNRGFLIVRRYKHVLNVGYFNLSKPHNFKQN